jgi:RNA recognition motif. (a.k.a. RRM, RBD, or RNP domain)
MNYPYVVVTTVSPSTKNTQKKKRGKSDLLTPFQNLPLPSPIDQTIANLSRSDLSYIFSRTHLLLSPSPTCLQFLWIAMASDKDRSPPPSLPSAVSTNVLFVGGLPPATTDEELMSVLGPHGALDSVTMRVPHGRSYAFVLFRSVETARAAMIAAQGATIHGGSMRIEIARPVLSLSLALSLLFVVRGLHGCLPRLGLAIGGLQNIGIAV